MIDLYYAPTPNTWKASIMLEECGVPHTAVPVDIMAGDQKKPEYLKPLRGMPLIASGDYSPAGSM